VSPNQPYYEFQVRFSYERVESNVSSERPAPVASPPADR